MKRALFLLNIICFLNVLVAQVQEDIIIGKRIMIKSEVLNSDREISVALPNSYEDNNYTHYPVIYVLDGKKYFHSFSGVISQLSSDAGPQIPEMIVVGITSQDRIKDSSPTNSLIEYSGKAENGYEVSGGADDFLKFIETELIPFIENNYRTNIYRTFVGYSFTGLAVVHALFSIPELFNSYLVIDFSAWWDDELMKKRIKKFSENYNGKKRDVFFATVDRVSNNIFPESYNSGWEFIQQFEQNSPSNISFHHEKYTYKIENHHSMPLISFMDGIKYIFRGHFVNYDVMLTNPHLLEAQFYKLSKRLGYSIFLTEELINFHGYLFLYTKPDIDKAIFYFKYNCKNYPLSSNAWDSLGEAYFVNKDYDLALESYKKAIELGGTNGNAKKMLEKIHLELNDN